MSVTVGQAKLKNGISDLLVKWEETKQVWNDKRAQEFQRDYIEALEPAVRSGLGAMDRMAAIINQAKQECG